ncbi:MAG: Gfo/Idh/MocA family oxidoreductase [Ferruginibacter sp.]
MNKKIQQQMNASGKNRRQFIKNATSAMGGIAFLSALPNSLKARTKKYENRRNNKLDKVPSRIRFAVIGINHGHINSQVDTVIRGGGSFVSFYAKEADLAANFAKLYPQAKAAVSEKDILEDRSIHLIICAAIPDERAAIGIAAMRHNKDFLVDKPAVTTLQQLAEVRDVQADTGRIYTVQYGRLENRGSLKAGELVKAGAIGKVIQTMALAPHRINPKTRPSWFFDSKRYGGIINDLGSHQFDEFLFFTGSSKADIVASQAANLHHPQKPGFEDFGDVMVTGDSGTGYMRLDWFTPEGLQSWGDDRVTILGTDGYIEVRKNIDIAGRPGGSHLFLVNQKETKYFDCAKHPLPFGKLFVDDILNRTNTSMQQDLCFLATELALKAQKQARTIKI